MIILIDNTTTEKNYLIAIRSIVLRILVCDHVRLGETKVTDLYVEVLDAVHTVTRLP